MANPVQTASTFTDGTSSTTVAVTLTATSGNALAVSAGSNATGGVPTISDGTNTYTLVDDQTDTGNYRAASWYAKNITGGSLTLTVTFTASSGFRYIVVHEITADATAPLNGHAAQVQTNTGTTADILRSGTPGTEVTTVNGDYIFGACVRTNDVISTIAAGTGFTLREQAPSPTTTINVSSEDQIQSVAGSIEATFTPTNAGRNYITFMMAFKPVAAAPPDPLQGAFIIG